MGRDPGGEIEAVVEAGFDRQVAQARVVLRRMRARSPGASRLLGIWERLLEGPPGEFAWVLLDRGPLARELRHVTPFAGILSARERAQVYRAFQASEQEVQS